MSQAATGLLSPDYLSITSYNLDEANIGICTLLKKDGFFSMIETFPFSCLKSFYGFPEAYSRD